MRSKKGEEISLKTLMLLRALIPIQQEKKETKPGNKLICLLDPQRLCVLVFT